MKNKTKIKLTILLLSLVQMATNGLSPMLSGVSKSFPEASAESVQLLMTIPGIFVVVFSLLAAWLATRIEKRHLVVCGAFFVLLSGILALQFHGSIWILWIWSGVLGIGMGLVSALAASMIPDYLEGQEKVVFMGAQTSFGNIGAMLMSIIGGGLASVAWHYNYLVFLIALPGLICGLLFLPKRPPKAEQERQSVRCSPKVWCYVMTACILMMASVCAQNAAQSAMGIALVMAGSNFGTFLTPIISWISRKVTGSTSAEGRYVICAGLVFVLMVLFAAGIFFEKRLKEKRASGY